MADTIIRFPAPPGLTVVAYLQKYGATAFVNASGHSATEQVFNSINTGDYQATVSESTTGWHRLYLVTSGNTSAFASYDIYLQDDTNTYKAVDTDQNVIFGTTQTTPTPSIVTGKQ